MRVGRWRDGYVLSASLEGSVGEDVGFEEVNKVGFDRGLLVELA